MHIINIVNIAGIPQPAHGWDWGGEAVGGVNRFLKRQTTARAAAAAAALPALHRQHWQRHKQHWQRRTRVILALSLLCLLKSCCCRCCCCCRVCCSTFTWPSHLVVSKVLPSLAMRKARRGGGGGGGENTQTDAEIGMQRRQQRVCVCMGAAHCECRGAAEGAWHCQFMKLVERQHGTPLDENVLKPNTTKFVAHNSQGQ